MHKILHCGSANGVLRFGSVDELSNRMAYCAVVMIAGALGLQARRMVGISSASTLFVHGYLSFDGQRHHPHDRHKPSFTPDTNCYRWTQSHNAYCTGPPFFFRRKTPLANWNVIDERFLNFS